MFRKKRTMYKPVQFLRGDEMPGLAGYAEYPVPPSIAAFVACCWSVIIGGESGVESWRILPDGCSDIIVDLVTGNSYCTGVTGETSYVPLEPGTAMFGIRFLPAAIPLLLRCDVSEFRNSGFETKYAVPAFSGTAAKVADASSMSERLRIVCGDAERFFSRCDFGGRFLSMLGHSLDEGGRMTVEELASMHQLSAKQVTRCFRQHTGLAAKEFLQIVRFQTFLSLLQRGEGGRLFAALDAGYYDQSHACRDMRKFLGIERIAR